LISFYPVLQQPQGGCQKKNIIRQLGQYSVVYILLIVTGMKGCNSIASCHLIIRKLSYTHTSN